MPDIILIASYAESLQIFKHLWINACASSVAGISITRRNYGDKEKASASKVVKASKPKKTVKKTSPKKQKELKPGNHYQCGICGLAVTVDAVCVVFISET